METEKEARMPGYIILGKRPLDNAYQGVVEGSFSMYLSPDYVNFFWTGTGYSMLGKHEVDGLKEAEHYQEYFASRYPDMVFEIFDVHSEDLPVVLDWDGLTAGLMPAETLSGVRNKFRARNFRFNMKEGS